MYKLFLCLRYLRSRIIAYFAVIAVALCVAMMLIVISVMNGFLDRIELAAKGLFGDVVVDSDSAAGFGRYDEFIAEMKQKVPGVEAASPFIVAYGLLCVPDTNYRQPVQVAGVRLPDEAQVTDFAKGLHFEQGSPSPTFDPDFGLVAKNLDAERQRMKAILERVLAASRGGDRQLSPDEEADLEFSLQQAMGTQAGTVAKLERDRQYQPQLRDLQQRLQQAKAESPGRRTEQIEKLEAELGALQEKSGLTPPSDRVILGLGIPGLTRRTPRGETIRLIVPGQNVGLSLLPLGRGLAGEMTPNNADLIIVDDCRTDVSSIDSQQLYVPFEKLQVLNNMAAEYAKDGKLVWPAKCSQIHVKVKPAFARDEQLTQVAAEISNLWRDFAERREDVAAGVTAQTWRQRQQRILEPIETQRTLVVTMFGIISLVSVVLIFVIFYTIVVQKTRDIGVVKAIGGSSWGVAQIFLGYGAMIGLVGSVLGCVGGYYFVRYINPIQDFLDTWLHFRVWRSDWFLFEKIPNTVEPLPAVLIVAGAILAGVVGALIPAWRAARMQPVEALRYE